MSTAMVLLADDPERRSNGRWARGSVDISINRNSESGWRQALHRAGIILDFVPELADDVVSGELEIAAAFSKAESVRDADRRKLVEQERLAAEEADAQAFVQVPDAVGRRAGRVDRRERTAQPDRHHH
jgi:hypothetical protein